MAIAITMLKLRNVDVSASKPIFGDALFCRHTNSGTSGLLPSEKILFCVYFLTDSAEDCNCWSVPIQGFYVRFENVGYPQCQRLAERVCSGTCDCTNTQYGRLVYFTSLHLACYYGQLEMVKYLMRFCESTAKFQDRAFLTPLMVSFIITSM